MPRFRKPSPAFALAFLALAVALSSSAGANPVALVAKAVNGSSIKKHSIPLSALSAAAVKTLHGATGPRGPRGLQGAAGGTNVKVVSQGCTPDGCNHASVACPAGSHATGGGGLVIGNELLWESRPVTTNNVPTGWEAAGGAASGPNTGGIVAYAVCASP